MKSIYKTFARIDCKLRDESNEPTLFMICNSDATVTVQ